MQWIAHIADTTCWQASDEAYGPASLEREGFVHGSFASQLEQTIARHYPQALSLTLLWIDPGKLVAELRVEDTTGHGAYPHIYGAINRDAIAAVHPLERRPTGEFLIPQPPEVG